MQKVVIIGSGHVGSVCAQVLARDMALPVVVDGPPLEFVPYYPPPSIEPPLVLTALPSVDIKARKMHKKPIFTGMPASGYMRCEKTNALKRIISKKHNKRQRQKERRKTFVIQSKPTTQDEQTEFYL